MPFRPVMASPKRFRLQTMTHDLGQHITKISVTDAMINAALSALTPFVEEGTLGYSDSRPAMAAALGAALSVAVGQIEETQKSRD